jgi:hypothetical protein
MCKVPRPRSTGSEARSKAREALVDARSYARQRIRALRQVAYPDAWAAPLRDGRGAMRPGRGPSITCSHHRIRLGVSNRCSSTPSASRATNGRSYVTACSTSPARAMQRQANRAPCGSWVQPGSRPIATRSGLRAALLGMRSPGASWVQLELIGALTRRLRTVRLFFRRPGGLLYLGVIRRRRAVLAKLQCRCRLRSDQRGAALLRFLGGHRTVRLQHEQLARARAGTAVGEMRRRRAGAKSDATRDHQNPRRIRGSNFARKLGSLGSEPVRQPNRVTLAARCCLASAPRVGRTR